MTPPAFTREQRAAIAARTGSSLLAANAGSGKTAVMVERIAAAVREDGIPVGAKDVRARGIVRDDVPGRYVNGDVVDRSTLEQTLDEAREVAARAAAELRAGRIRPCPERCAFNGTCAHPGICRA